MIYGRVNVALEAPTPRKSDSEEVAAVAARAYEDELRRQILAAARPISDEAGTGLVWLVLEQKGQEPRGIEVSFGTDPASIRELTPDEWPGIAGVVAPAIEEAPVEEEPPQKSGGDAGEQEPGE